MIKLLEHLPVLVILFPLCATLLCPLISHFKPSFGKKVVMTGLFLSVVCAVTQLWQVVSTGEALHYYLGGWKPPFGIEFVID